MYYKFRFKKEYIDDEPVYRPKIKSFCPMPEKAKRLLLY